MVLSESVLCTSRRVGLRENANIAPTSCRRVFEKASDNYFKPLISCKLRMRLSSQDCFPHLWFSRSNTHISNMHWNTNNHYFFRFRTTGVCRPRAYYTNLTYTRGQRKSRQNIIMSRGPRNVSLNDCGLGGVVWCGLVGGWVGVMAAV